MPSRLRSGARYDLSPAPAGRAAGPSGGLRTALVIPGAVLESESGSWASSTVGAALVNARAAIAAEPGSLWSLSALATEFEMDRRTVKRRLDSVGPSGTVRGHHGYRMRDVAPALLAGHGVGGEDEVPADPFKRKAYWQARAEEEQFRERRGELLERQAVEQLFAGAMKVLVLAMETLPDDIERRLGLTADQVDDFVRICDERRAEVHTSLLRLAAELQR